MGLFTRIFGASKEKAKKVIEVAQPYVDNTVDAIGDAKDAVRETAFSVGNTAREKVADAADSVSNKLRGDEVPAEAERPVLAGDKPKPRSKKSK